jgi:hypothetical protein
MRARERRPRFGKRWRPASSRMRWECPPVPESGRSLPSHTGGNRSGAGVLRAPCTRASSGPPRFRKRPGRLEAGRTSAGGKGAKVGCSLASGRAVCRLRLDFQRVGSQAKRSGCWGSGRKRPRRPPGISWVICPATTACAAGCGWRKRAGKSSRTRNSSKENSDWIMRRAGVGTDGITR